MKRFLSGQSGDTLYQLGTTYDVPIEQLLLIKPVEPTRLEIGQTVGNTSNNRTTNHECT